MRTPQISTTSDERLASRLVVTSLSGGKRRWDLSRTPASGPVQEVV